MRVIDRYQCIKKNIETSSSIQRSIIDDSLLERKSTQIHTIQEFQRLSWYIRAKVILFLPEVQSGGKLQIFLRKLAYER